MKRPTSSRFALATGVHGSQLGFPHRPGSLGQLGGAMRRTPWRPYSVTGGGRGVAGPDDPPAQADLAEQDDPRIRQMRLEAVLLLAKTPLSPRKLSQLAHLADATEARTLVRQLNRTYDTLGRAVRVEQVAGGYRLLTRPALAPWLARLGHLPPVVKLSTPMMETLAVVAYRQPVSRASAEAVRGVACGELLRQLMERELIRIVGRSEELGRPYLYGTTKRFLQLFGLPHADALPPIQWHALQEDPISEDSPPDDLSTSTKEPVVSTTVAPVLAEADPEVLGVAGTLVPSRDASSAPQEPRAAIEDEEDELYGDDDEEDDDDDWDEDDDDDDDWDDDEDEDDDEDDDELDDEDDVDGDDDGWEEVDDEDADEDVDDDEDDDDEEDAEDDDVAWDEDDDEEEWEDEDDVDVEEDDEEEEAWD